MGIDSDGCAFDTMEVKHKECFIPAFIKHFGLAAIIEDGNSVGGASDDKTGGTIRWMAPEILDPERYGYVGRARRKLPSKSTDIYALGMTILEARTNSLLLLSLSRNVDLPR